MKLEQQVRSLKLAKRLKKLGVKQNTYWQWAKSSYSGGYILINEHKGQDGKPKGKPYCPVCEQKSGQLFHLTRIAGKDICPNCKSLFNMVTIFHE